MPVQTDDLFDMLFNQKDGLINTELLTSVPSKSLDMPSLSFVSMIVYFCS